MVSGPGSSKNNKRKKFHDKDKYYNLAKEQGLRSRAAFKLSQINRQYPILSSSKTKVVLDLCAAPGGWTQIASRTCGPQTQIVAVDILPIRNLKQRNITTIVGDITTDKCKSDINRAIASYGNGVNNKNKNKKDAKDGGGGGTVDVVLHDGAPNVGAAYEKDAYVQMELSVHALRCATQHLKKGGCFITKIYRSRDSQSFQWVVNQFFDSVTIFKPKASRQQSAEIFYICQNYFAPNKIDPKMLDPKYIFEYVEGDTTGGGMMGSGQQLSKFNVFHKSWDIQKKHRDGYDLDHYDGTMRHIEPLKNFFLAKGKMDAIQVLSRCTSFKINDDDDDDNVDGISSSSSSSKDYWYHPLTTPEIKECLTDLKVLNKSDFKSLMIWREKLLQSLEERKMNKKDDDDDDDEVMKGDGGSDDDGSDDDDDDDDSKKKKKKKKKGDEQYDEEDEDKIQAEIKALRLKKLREQKKKKKKERKISAKKRRQAALGMDANAIEIQDTSDEVFNLATLKSKADLDKVSEVNIDQLTDEQVFGKDDDDDDDDDKDNSDDDDDDDEKKEEYRRKVRERDLDDAYDRYLESTKDGMAKAGTKAAKRSKKLMRERVAQESHEDYELALGKNLSKDTMKYAQLLQGKQGSDDDSDDDSSSEDEDEDALMEDTKKKDVVVSPKKKKQKMTVVNNSTTTTPDDDDDDDDSHNPLLAPKRSDPSSVRTARWFSNPLFASIGETVEAASKKENNNTVGSKNKNKKEANIYMGSDDDDKEGIESGRDGGGEEDSGDEGDGEEDDSRKKTKKQSKKKSVGLDANEVLSLIPKTDKQKRHELRMRAVARDERRHARKAKKLGESEKDFDLVPSAKDEDEEEEEEDVEQLAGMTAAKKKRLRDAKALIKAGMGKATGDDDGHENKKGFEVVERPLPLMDGRKYDSDNEEYDSDDNARTMALGTMMLRQSKAKALVDASYNRYAWNDPGDLPDWFVDDESRHHRPQLPIPQALLDKMKEKMVALSTRPIAKVAEARARKNRKAKLKLSAAKKKAQAVSNSSEMTETMKLKAISKALRSNDSKGQGKRTVVAKKGGKPVKGARMVDKRMKNDQRGMDRATKKKKGGGKKGGLTGSKRRRHHK